MECYLKPVISLFVYIWFEGEDIREESFPFSILVPEKWTLTPYLRNRYNSFYNQIFYCNEKFM